MTKNRVIEQLFLGKNFNDCIARMEPRHLQEELKSEVIAIVCEWSEEKIVGLHERQQLEIYVVRVILNQIKSKSSGFFKMYRQTFEEISNEHPKAYENIVTMEEWQDRLHKEAAEDDVLDEIERLKNDENSSTLYWYNAELLKLYIKHGNYRGIADETGIPHVSCYKNIRSSFETLKQKALKKKRKAA